MLPHLSLQSNISALWEQLWQRPGWLAQDLGAFKDLRSA
jgi:hypothetical protein